MSTTRHVAVRLTPDALRQVRGGHPWVFASSVRSQRPEGGEAGDVAVVFDDHRRFAAVGLLDPASPVAVRVLARTRADVGPDLWRTRIAEALARRSELAADGRTTGYRVVHGEADGLGGLVLDRYGATAVLKVYSAAWLAHLDDVVGAAVDVLAPERLVLRRARALRGLAGPADGTTLVGPAPDGPVVFLEHGLGFEADVVRGQKTGHFLDQRDTRALAARWARGAEVLDVFCCTGGFAVHAVAAGARSVHLVDASAAAVATARRNLDRNRDPGRPVAVGSSLGDAFAVLGDLRHDGRRFDLVIVDPPSFAQQQAHVPQALAAYRRLARLALGVVRPGGVVVLQSCSSRVDAEAFHRVVAEGIAAEGWVAQELARTGHPVDHPVTFPEGAYLKGVVARVRPRRAG